MRKEIIEIGKTVDQAIESACEKLGCARENCEWEILDLPRKGFLGIKVFPAKVKVSMEEGGDSPPLSGGTVPDPPASFVRPEPKQPTRGSTSGFMRAPVKPQVPASAPTRTPAPSSAPARTFTPAPTSAATPSRPSYVPNEESTNVLTRRRVLVEKDFTEKECLAIEYIESILAEFSVKSTLLLYREESGICINITGDGLGTIIGRRGETLDAIQYLTSLVANRVEGDYMRVTVDCGDYRNKRKETLEALAKKLAGQVLKTNVSKSLEPMNPFERRVIHATVSKIEGVSSSSVGEEPNRRVVITSPTARKPVPGRTGPGRPGPGRSFSRDGEHGTFERKFPPRDDRGSPDRGGYRGKEENRRPPVAPSSSAPVKPSEPKPTPEAAVIVGTTYGKVDLE